MKERITIIVLGHVDHGKSTLVGRFLFEKGVVPKEEIERYAHLGAKIGKASFKYAWVLDQSYESRKRGLTTDLNFADVETRHRDMHIIDAPGHRDFLRSMITGTTGADAALLVMDSKEGVMPQTREHAQLAKFMGIERIVVALNKIDRVGYDPRIIGKTAADAKALLEDLGFTEIDIIPVSAIYGQNLTERGSSMGWYKGRTLEAVLDLILPKRGPKTGSFRMPVMQVIKKGGVGTVVLGRVERGMVSEGDEVLVMPVNKVGIIRSIEAYGKRVHKSRAGETIGMALRGIGRLDVSRGDVLGPKDDPPRLVGEFTAKIVLMDEVGVVKPGWSPYIHCHTAAVPVRLEAIEMKLQPESGVPLNEKETGVLLRHDAAMVRMRPLKPLIIEPGDVLPSMARFALRASRSTLGAGSCVSVQALKRNTPGTDRKGPGFSYKWRKVGRGAKEKKARKEKESKDIWGKPKKTE